MICVKRGEMGRAVPVDEIERPALDHRHRLAVTHEEDLARTRSRGEAVTADLAGRSSSRTYRSPVEGAWPGGGPAKRVPSLGKMVPRVIVLFMRLRATGPRAMRAATACRHAQVTAILLSIASKQPLHMPFIHR